VFGSERPLLVAEFAALRLQVLGGIDVALAPEPADLLGDGVHTRPDGVTTTGDVEEPGIEVRCFVDLVEQRWSPTPGQRCFDAGEVGAQESLVDHANER
jgi:hypothetical protein